MKRVDTVLKEKKPFNYRRLGAGALFLGLLLAFVLRASYVLPPERTSYGSTWNMYLQEPENSIDLLFFGSSMAYCDVIPAQLNAETGLSAYLMAGPEQTYSITYAYMKEALRTQKPRAVFLEITGVMFDRYQNYTKANLSYMPYFSVNRLEAVFRAAEPEERFGLLFPLYNYHDRWAEAGLLSLFRPRSDDVRDPWAGATLMEESTPQASVGEREYATAEDVFAENLEWLAKIRALCAEKNLRLVLFQVPSCACIPEEWMTRIRSSIGDTELVDFNADFDAMGLDPATDFYDFLHCDFNGAVKFNHALSAWINASGLSSARNWDPELWAWRREMLEQRL